MSFLSWFEKRVRRNSTSNNTGRESRIRDKHQSSSVSRTSSFVSRPRPSESVLNTLGRLRRLKRLRLDLQEVAKSLSVLFMHYPYSICRVPFFGRLWFPHLDYHRDHLASVSDVFGLEAFDHLRRLLLELREVERTLSVLDMYYTYPTPRVSFSGELCFPDLDYDTVYDAFGRDLFGLDDFVRFELQEVERNLPVLHGKYNWLFKILKPQLASTRRRYKRQQTIERPWTDFPAERNSFSQVSSDAYRPLTFRYSGREHEHHIVRQTSNLNDLQAQRELIDHWAIENSVDTNVNSLKKVSKWRLWEGRSKEWRRCKLLKMLSSTPSATLAVKGKRLDPLQWEKAGATAPTTMLQRNPRFRRVHAPKKEAAKQWRRNDSCKGSSRVRILEVEGEALCDEPIESSAPSDELVCSFEDIRLEMRAAPPSLIPYENYIGAILGDQFQLGPMIRQESDGDVYLVDSLNKSTRNLEAKAYTLSELSKSQRKATKKLRKRLCSIDQAGKKFVVYRVDGQSQDSKKQQQRPMLQAPDAYSSHNRLTRSTVAQLHTSSKTGRAGEIELGKDERNIIVARGSKQPTHNVGDGHGEAAGSFHVTNVKARRHKTSVAKQSPKLLTMKAADNSQDEDVPKKKKRKQRNRGLKKAKVPRFSTLWELESFLAIMGSRLTIRQRELSTGMVWHKKMAKTVAATQRQYDTLTSRFFRARKKWHDWQILRGKICDQVHRWIPLIEEEQFDLEETSWTLRKNPPFGARSNMKRSKPLPQILDYYQVFNFGDLDGLERERMIEIERILNGEEGLYRRL